MRGHGSERTARGRTGYACAGPPRPHRGGHWFLWEAVKPVIAAIDGPAAGLGVELAAQADLRIASSRARLSWIFVQRGLISDIGAGTWLLPAQVGSQMAERLVRWRSPMPSS
ncbi:enoyl-CoA hydratase-related protein [Nocardia higoensis]|uniref:enoyl-CoA hydratase/isomerase family protein n=1 Tax=Nocardia higoensis TaxID=228599 RepID=UPI003A5D21B5